MDKFSELKAVERIHVITPEIFGDVVRADDYDALLAELEGTEQTLNVANDATRLWKERALAAEQKLATPVIRSADSDPQREHFGCNVRTTDSGTFYITKLGSVPGRDMALYRNEAEALFIGLRDALAAGFTVGDDR